jgi:hypothetical protein
MASFIGTGGTNPGDVCTNGKIAAGHSSPAYQIDSLGRCFIRGSGGGGGGFWSSDSDDAGTGVSFIGRGDDAENQVGIYSNGAWRMVIKDTGKTGFGTTTPAATVHVNAVLRLEPQSNAPAACGKGDMYINTSGELFVHNGTTFRKVAFV